jgi:hypothetical protein
VSTDAARVLLGSIIDYAGLFPPAELDMRPAVAGYASIQGGPEAWMLGRFVLPLTRLEEFELALDELSSGAGTTRWPLAVIGGKNLEADAERIIEFNVRHGNRVAPDARIETLDLKARGAEDVFRAGDVPAGPVERYFEIAVDGNVSAVLAAVAKTGGRAKIRTGGLTANLFPSAHDLGRFLEACAAEHVAFKATAGLHHPVRSAHPVGAGGRSPVVTMHGFLNLFLAAALARKHGARADALEPVLGEQSPGAFRFGAAGVEVRGHHLACEEIASARQSFALSFGSCSFDEPVSDLKSLGIL